MKQLKLLIYFLLGFVLVLFDVSFLSNFEIYGATVLLSFSFLVILAVVRPFEDFMYFSLSLVILFAIFSSLPLFLVVLNFVLLPLLINFVRTKYFHRPGRLGMIAYLAVANFLFELILTIWAKELNQSGFLAIGYFTLINTFTGFIINLIYSAFYGQTRSQKEIRI